MLAGGLARLRARLGARRGEAAEAPDALCLVVSESGWRATLFPGDGGPPVLSAEMASPEEAPATTPEVLRRAIRSITPAQRERLDSVRLVVDDAAFGLADNRALRLRSTDPVAVRHAGTQELGSKGAVYGVLPLGASSEGEVPRGAYAFASAERVGDYLAAMDSLAPRLVGLVPAWLARLAAAGPGPFAALELRAETAMLVLADPDGGTLACRHLAVGTRSLATALAAATGVTVREAAEGLARRRCVPQADAPDGAPGSALPPTLASHALAAPLDALRAALLESVEYFVFQRLAAAPERLLLSGEAARVRGLADWLGAVLEAEVVSAPDLMPEPGPRAGEGANLLESTPQQLLRVGRTGYEFVRGRFQAEQRQPGSPAATRGGLRDLATQPLGLATLRALPAAVMAALPGGSVTARRRAPVPPGERAQGGGGANGRRGLRLPRMALPGLPVLAVAALAGLALLAGVLPLPWGGSATGGLAVLSEQLATDAALRRELARREAPSPVPPDVPLPWSGRLLALARLVPEPMRLTELTVLPDPTRPGHDGRLSLQGRLPAGADALAEVATVTDRLAADPGFATGLAAPGLEGVSVVPDAGAAASPGTGADATRGAGADATRGAGADATRGAGADATEFVVSAPVLPSPGHP